MQHAAPDGAECGVVEWPDQISLCAAAAFPETQQVNAVKPDCHNHVPFHPALPFPWLGQIEANIDLFMIRHDMIGRHCAERNDGAQANTSLDRL